MRPHYSLVTAGQVEPLTIEQATEHVRIDSNDDLAYLQALIAVAREYVESVTGIVGLKSTWKVVAPSWHALIHGDDSKLSIPSRNVYAIPLFRAPLVSVSSIKYYTNGSESQTTITASDYRVITDTTPGMVQFIDSPPNVEDRPDAIEITFIAGYADQCSAPAIWRHAQKLIVAHLYENRVPVNIGNIVNELPFTLKTMLEQQKIGGWVA